MADVRWVDVGALSDIPLRGARRICLDGRPIAIFRTGDDEVFALIDRCPHRGGPLSEGIVSGRAVVCPLHNWQIDLETGRVCAPDEGSTEVLDVRRSGERILIALSVPQHAVSVGKSLAG